MPKIKQRRYGFSIVQIPGPLFSPFINGEGDTFIIPLEILGGNPTISGRLLEEGTYTYTKVKENVLISPRVRLLFLLP